MFYSPARFFFFYWYGDHLDLHNLRHSFPTRRSSDLIAAPAAAVTGGLVLFSLWGYSRTRKKSWSDLGLFVVATCVVAGFFVAIFAAFAPQYLGMFKHLFDR